MFFDLEVFAIQFHVIKNNVSPIESFCSVAFYCVLLGFVL